MNEWVKKKILITVKAYPNPSAKYGESVCVAGIDIDTKEWLRIYPIPYRDIPFSKRFKKYQIVEIEVTKHSKDPRPESYRPKLESIKIIDELSTRNDPRWEARRNIILPTVSKSMCEIQRLYDAGKQKTLGVFKPKKVIDFSIIEGEAEWSDKKGVTLAQLSLFNPKKKELEKIPYTFKYVYICDESDCPGHSQSTVDWEVAESWRSWRTRYRNPEILKQKLREKYFERMCGIQRETYFFVGSHSLYPIFMILGVFWPEK